jgi:PadR family transcriptional regulator
MSSPIVRFVLNSPVKKTKRALTELESCVLGVVWQRGPCTAYTVRREHWSSSAGSIYPVLARLESLGLIDGEEASWGAGTKKHYRATAATAARGVGRRVDVRSDSHALVLSRRTDAGGASARGVVCELEGRLRWLAMVTKELAAG